MGQKSNSAMPSDKKKIPIWKEKEKNSYRNEESSENVRKIYHKETSVL